MTSAFAAIHTRTFASLRKHRNYRLYFIGQMVSVSGTWMGDTALPWLVLQHSRSPAAVGLLLAFRFLPFSLFGLFAGLLADRFDNRRALIATQTASMVIAAALAALAWSGGRPFWAIYVFAFLGGSAVVFDAPNRTGLTFRLVGRDELPNAIALNSSLMNAGRIVGPAVAGVIIAIAGVGTCFALNAVSFLAVLTVLTLIRSEDMFPIDRGIDPPRGWSALHEGLRYVLRDRRLALVIGITAVVTVTGFNFRVLLPLLAQQTLHIGSGMFGVLFACFGTGALFGALIAATALRPSWGRLLAGVGAFSGAMLVLAPLRSVWAAAVLLFVAGLGFTLWTSNSQAILQLTAPDRLRGRIVSLYLFVFAGLTPAGSLIAGALASVGGTRLAFGVAGGVGLAATAVGIVSIRRIRAAVPAGHPPPLPVAEPPV